MVKATETSKAKPTASRRGCGLKFKYITYKTVACFTAGTLIKFGPNPKTVGTKSFVRFAKYAKAKTVGEALKFGAKNADLLWDLERGYYKVVGGPRLSKPSLLLAPKQGSMSKAEKALRTFRGPRGMSLKMDEGKRKRCEQLASELGVDLDMVEEEPAGLGSRESGDVRTERRVADALAGRTLSRVKAQGRKVTSRDVLEVLKTWGFAENDSRQNVLPEGKDWVYSDTVGLIQIRTGRLLLTRVTTMYPNVVKLLTRWLADNPPKGLNSTFVYTSININANYAARIHRDQNNEGPSVIQALGNFKGGKLRYWPGDVARQPRPRPAALPLSDSVLLDIRNRFEVFDGNRAHAVEAFAGERFSVVFFTARRFATATEQDRNTAVTLGFPWPTAAKMASLKRAQKNMEV